MSPVARLLDWLSLTYGVLFVVSAGNQSDAIQLGISRTEFESSDPQEQEVAVVKALFSDVRNRKLLSPAETINGLMVGSTHQDESQLTYQGNRIDPFKRPLPNPVSAFGNIIIKKKTP